MNQKKLLLLGASGLVGRYVYNLAKKNDISVIGTFCSNQMNITDLVKFDFRSDDINDIVDAHFSTDNQNIAILCSAISSINECFANRNVSYDINVTKTKSIISDLHKRGFKIIFLSSASVFDGIEGNYNESSEPNPINEYGRQKREIEKFLDSYPGHLCVRLPVLVSYNLSEKHILNGLYNTCCQKKVIYYINGYTISPTLVDDVAIALLLLLSSNYTGLYHISSHESFSWDQFSALFVKYLGGGGCLMVNKPAHFFNFTEPRGLKSNLDGTKFRDEFHFNFTTMRRVFSKISKGEIIYGK